MEKYLEKVQKAFSFHIYNVEKTKSGIILKTSKGKKILKRLPFNPDTIRNLHNIKQSIVSNGFQNVDNFLVQKDGLPYVETEEGIFVVSSFIDGDTADFSDIDTVIAIAQSLALLHKAMLKSSTGTFNLYNKEFYKFYNKRIIELGRIKKRILNLPSRNEMDHTFLENYDFIMGLCVKAYEGMELFGQSNIWLCHNAIKEENILLESRKDNEMIGCHMIHFVNFECMSPDFLVKDLSEVIRRYLKEKNSQDKAVSKIILSYNEILPLYHSDLQLLFATLIFPYKYLKICNEYYNRRRTLLSSPMIKRFEASANQMRRQATVADMLNKK